MHNYMQINNNVPYNVQLYVLKYTIKNISAVV